MESSQPSKNSSPPSPYRTLLHQSHGARQCDSPEPYDASLNNEHYANDDNHGQSPHRQALAHSDSSESILSQQSHRQEIPRENGRIRYAVPDSLAYGASRNNTANTRISSGTEEAWSGSFVLSLGILTHPILCTHD